MHDALIKVESSILVIRLSHESDVSFLLAKIKELQKTNEKLSSNVNKQKERLNNVQNQLNLTRNANIKLNETVDRIDKQLSDFSSSQGVIRIKQTETKSFNFNTRV